MMRNSGFAFTVALVGILAIGPISITIYMPALPSVQREFSAGAHLVQLTLSLPLIAAIVAPAIVGWLSDLYGRRLAALASLSLCLIFSVVAMHADDLWTLLIARTVLGASGTCALVVGRAIVSDRYEAAELTAAMARYASIPVAAIMIAPVIGGYLINEAGWRAVFAFLAGTSLLLLLLSLFTLSETAPRNGVTDHIGEREDKALAEAPSHLPLLRSRLFVAYIGQSVFHFGVAVGFVASVPYIVENRLGLSALDGGLGLIAIIFGLLLGVLAAGQLARRMSRPVQVFCGSLIGVVSGLCMLLIIGNASIELSMVGLFAPTTITAIGIGFAMPGSQAGIVGTEPRLAGFASGLSSCLQLLMAAVFVHLIALEWTEPEMALAIITVAGMAAAVLFSALAISRPAIKA